jgi:hypothetical protein
MEKKFRKTFENMEGFSFVTPVTGLNRPNTGKEDDDDENIRAYISNLSKKKLNSSIKYQVPFG